MTEPKITSVEKTPIVKNPGRVAAGKRLAAISREAKERKKLERENAIRNMRNLSNGENAVLLLGIGLIAGAALYFHLWNAERNDTQRDNEEPSQKEERKEPKGPKKVNEPKQAPKFQAYSMDD